MTYNISHGEGPDRTIDLARIAAVIDAQMPDLVSLQEVDNQTTRSMGIDQAAKIAELAGLPHVLFGRAIDFGGGEYGVAILSRHPFILDGLELLPTTSGNEQRIALWSVVSVPEIGEVMFVASHLEAYFFDEDRVAQATELKRLFSDAVLAPSGTAFPDTVVLAGDFNADSGSPTIDVLESGFDDAYVGDSETTFVAGAEPVVFDRVYLRPGAVKMSLASWVVDAPEASDHSAVVVDLQ